MDVELYRLAAQQDDMVARWQLLAVGWSRHGVDHHARARRWRPVHDGVYAMKQAPLTRRQRWFAATLTAPDSFLAELSATACFGFHEWEGPYETVVRAGSGGRRQHPGLVVARSTTLKGQTGWKDGIPIVSPERALIGLAALVGPGQLGRAFRESIRLRCTTADAISRALAGQRGTALLVDRCDRYATIPYHRCRSDAESAGLEVLHDAGVPPPKVNVPVAGARPDYYWPRLKRIIEIDGPQFHLFAEEDAAKQERWEAVGNEVRRIPSGDVYAHPERLIRLATQPNGQIVRP
jgi:hypothetical protein